MASYFETKSEESLEVVLKVSSMLNTVQHWKCEELVASESCFFVLAYSTSKNAQRVKMEPLKCLPAHSQGPAG